MGYFSRTGHDLYTGRRSIDFVGRRRLWYSTSVLIVALAVFGLVYKGFNMGIEFVGGAEYKVTLDSPVSQDVADELRTNVAATGIESASSPVVTTSGEDSVIVQTEPVDDEESAAIEKVILDTTGASADQLSQTEIGASWGREVAKRSLIGLVVFLVLVVLFIWAYFREWKMSVAAIVALAHDVLITVGVYALSGFEVTPATVTGILTILGFSLYDTVVVFDKVRENTADLRRTHQTYAEAANLAVNQTLVRSINTSLVALIPVGAILYVGVVQLGSGSLKDLALALFVGMAAGAYSSIFIATPLLVQLKMAEKDLQLLDRRTRARRRHEADRYASVPAFREDLPPADEPEETEADSAADEDEDDEREEATRPRPAAARAAGRPGGVPLMKEEAAGKGRVAPAARGPVKKSASSGRSQPTRQSRAKRGRK